MLRPEEQEVGSQVRGKSILRRSEPRFIRISDVQSPKPGNNGMEPLEPFSAYIFSELNQKELNRYRGNMNGITFLLDTRPGWSHGVNPSCPMADRAYESYREGYIL